MPEVEILIVGAGIAGLSCARELVRAGLSPVVLEKSRGVGGRCATRRVEGQPVDHGVLFLHGAGAEFIAEVEAVDSPRLADWPERVEGTGMPCKPEAFAPHERRWAFPSGVSVFPKHLAKSLEVQLETTVREIRADRGAMAALTDHGESIRSRTLILALALEQSASLLESSGPAGGEQAAAALRLIRMMSTVPCLTLLAGYSREAPAPPWDVRYPEDSPVLQLISNDSAKRARPRFTVLVYQARPRWSRERLDLPPETWGSEILKEAGRRLGPWAARPAWVQAHPWRYSRLEPGNELAGPMLWEVEDGSLLGLAGELFSPGGGVEAAWMSGRRLARRLLEKGEA